MTVNRSRQREAAETVRASVNSHNVNALMKNADATTRCVLEHDIRRSLDEQEFALEFQPQIELASGRIVGFESLLRWRPDGAPAVSPNEFIPLLEEHGLISLVGEWAIEAVCRQRREWHDRGLLPEECRIAINLSAHQFLDEGLGPLLQQMITRYDLAPAMIEMELTESVLMQDTAQTCRILARIRDIGFKLSVDDFGTGYSSFAYLKRFHLDTLKIDRAFVTHLATGAKDLTIATSIIQLSHALGLKTVAEGVETAEQLAVLHNMKCDFAQGYLFSRPLPAAAVPGFVQGWRGLDSLRTDARTT
jgi:EAL domain-containing protein (putative c-di-GMP-specific phosphodiesterase class I)